MTIKPRETRPLGRTEIRITPIGLGCWQFSNGKGITGKFWDNLDSPTMTDIVETSLVGGVNWFDTAEAYGWGNSEQALSNALLELGAEPGKIKIATKWWPLFRTSGNIPKTIDNRLKFLQGYPIDLYQVHQPYSFSGVSAQMHRMADLVAAGHIRSIGVGNFSAPAMEKAAETLASRGLTLASNQVKYSLLDRRIETNGILEMAKSLGTTIIAYSPLAQGVLTGKFHHNPDLIKTRQGPRKFLSAFKKSGLAESGPVVAHLEKLAEKYGVTPGQVALNWVIHFHGETIVAIPGASKPRQAAENAGVMDFTLTREDLDLLNLVSEKYKVH
ncbi:MAG: aldo/keto reductase [Lentisphaeria bacterium]|nr:aldo/keto reductase [Lentisphaeria bacterium]